MCKSLIFNALCLTVVLAATTAQADNLFSKVGSPFGPSENEGATPPRPTPQRLAGPASLSEMLQNAGLQPREIDTRVISVKVQGLNVLLTFTEDYDRLRMVMVLSAQAEGDSPPAETLVGLMDANRENTAAFFAYSKKQRRIELHRIVENRSMTPDRLKGELGGMLKIALESKELWAVNLTEKPKSTETASSQPEPAPAAKPQPKSNQDLLVGRWAASRSKTEAFALQINADGTFALVTVISGKTSQSTGKFTISGNTLTLVAKEGTQIAGTLTVSSAKQFKFQPNGAKTALTFNKAS